MVVPSSRLAVFLSLQLVLLSVHLTHGGILGRETHIGDATSGQPDRSPDLTHGVRPEPMITQQGRPLTGFPVGTPGPVGDEPIGPGRHSKPNDSPKGRSETRKDFNEGANAFNSPPSSPPIHSGVNTRKGNSSVSAIRVPTSSSSPPPTAAAVTRSPALEEIEQLARLEMLKRTFLEKLGLERPPNITRPKPDVPDVVLNRLLLPDREQNDQPRRLTDTHPRQIVVFADEDYSDCGREVADDSCFRFEVPDQMDDAVEVFSSHLWVYVTHAPEGASVFIGRPQHHNGSKWRFLTSKKLYSREGWVELEIPADKHKWNRRIHYFEISTKPLQADGNRTVARDSQRRPMLLLAMAEGGRSARIGRSAGQCTAGQTTCCMKDFVVNFATIGWDSWIIRPLSFDAHYCSGECSVSSRHFLKDHSEVKALLLEHDAAEAGMSLCCVPNVVSGQAVFYYDDYAVPTLKLIDVVVENCGCL